MTTIKLRDVYGNGRIAQHTIEFLYLLLLDRPAEANISHKQAPVFAQHADYVRSRPYWQWFIIENADGNWVGAISITDRNEIGIFVLKAHHRKGYGITAVREVLRALKPLEAVPSTRRGVFIANVAPANSASHELFRKLGGKPIQVTYELPAVALEAQESPGTGLQT